MSEAGMAGKKELFSVESAYTFPVKWRKLLKYKENTNIL